MSIRRELTAALREALAVDPVTGNLTVTQKEPVVVTPIDPDEIRIFEALKMLGDETVNEYREGRMSRDEALRIARWREKELGEMR